VISTPLITSDRKPTQATTRHSQRGRTGRERPDVEADAVDEGGPRLQAPTDCKACITAPSSSTSHPPQQQDRVYRELLPSTGKGARSDAGHLRSDTRPAAGPVRAPPRPRPGPAPAAVRPANAALHDTSPANNNSPEEMRTSCHQQPAPPPCDAAKMSPHISISPEPVLAAHANWRPCDRVCA